MLLNQNKVNMKKLLNQNKDKRGGKRDNSGRPSAWLSKEKRSVIKIPSDIKNEVLEFAHKIDTEKHSETNN